MNPPVVEIQRKKQARLRPINKLHDPYIAAVMIGLAQAQRRAGTPSDERQTPPTGSVLDAFTCRSQNPLGFTSSSI